MSGTTIDAMLIRKPATISATGLRLPGLSIQRLKGEL